MKNFQKLNLTFDISGVDFKKVVPHRTFSTRQAYNKNLDPEFEAVPISTLTLPDEMNELLIKQLPQRILDVEVPMIYVLHIAESFASIPVLAPHVDMGRQCSINVYVVASGEITSSYRWDEQTKTLHDAEHFVAKEGECWLLNSQVPHSVTMKPGVSRTMISFSFLKTPFSTIKELYAQEDLQA